MNSEQDFARLKRELDLAQRYWLETVRPYIANRKLRGAELHIANDAHAKLRHAWQDAEKWNSTAQSGESSIVLPDLGLPDYAQPEPLYGDDLKPEMLATIAVSLKPNSGRRSLLKTQSEQLTTSYWRLSVTLQLSLSGPLLNG